MGDTLHLHQPFLLQRRYADRQLLVQELRVCYPKVRQGVVIDRYPTTEPTVGVVLQTQARQCPCTTHTLDRRIQPQGNEDHRIDRRAPGAPFHGSNAIIQRRQIHPLNKRPHRPYRVIVCNQVIERARMQLDLVTVRASVTRGCFARRRLGTEGGFRHRCQYFIKQRDRLHFLPSTTCSAHRLFYLPTNPLPTTSCGFYPPSRLILWSVDTTHHGMSESERILDFFTASQIFLDANPF